MRDKKSSTKPEKKEIRRIVKNEDFEDRATYLRAR